MSRRASLVLVALASTYPMTFSSLRVESPIICTGSPWTVIFATKLSAQLANNSSQCNISACYGSDADRNPSYRKYPAEVRPFATELCPLQIDSKVRGFGSQQRATSVFAILFVPSPRRSPNFLHAVGEATPVIWLSQRSNTKTCSSSHLHCFIRVSINPVKAIT